jgi:hypothetical protein
MSARSFGSSIIKKAFKSSRLSSDLTVKTVFASLSYFVRFMTVASPEAPRWQLCHVSPAQVNGMMRPLNLAREKRQNPPPVRRRLDFLLPKPPVKANKPASPAKHHPPVLPFRVPYPEYSGRVVPSRWAWGENSVVRYRSRNNPGNRSLRCGDAHSAADAMKCACRGKGVLVNWHSDRNRPLAVYQFGKPEWNQIPAHGVE